MWRRGKKRSDGEGAGGRGGDSDMAPASKRAKDSEDDFDGIVVGEIGKNRRVSVRSWQGRVVVDIREFYVKDGKTLPGRKGISLPMDQWKILRDHINEIDKLVKENS
ncbi:ssDNA-binding transcriptional regulator domain-containing protein [Dioscorea alata]|uniref:SsDNA-binding transcriptional regulator domain-containing protein n=1 Tax=Dioscorea alata TaxID=55571 RepID=A0ACB7WBI9_DIOAL|nr:ssDNA-binding transcriptional regulator domain-containing protein [Dioscorea alata]